MVTVKETLTSFVPFKIDFQSKDTLQKACQLIHRPVQKFG